VFSGITSVVTVTGRPSVAAALVGAVIVRPMGRLADDSVHPEHDGFPRGRHLRPISEADCPAVAGSPDLLWNT
jgi:hypothetical protein